MADKWKITGTYFETCNCETVCPCFFLSEPTTGECTALVGWHIDSGGLGDLDISGLSVALAVYSPGHMASTPWQVALYLDDKANEAQQGALGQIFGGQAGGHFAILGQHIGEVLGAAPVPITYKVDGKKRSMTLGTIAVAEVEAMSGQGGGDVTISGIPLAVSPGFPGVAGHSSKFEYHDHGMDWEISGKSSAQSPFSYEGP